MTARVRRPRWLRIPGRRSGDGGPDKPNDAAELTLSGHLVELRNRIYISVLSLLPGIVLGYIFGDEIVRILIAPLPTDHLVALGLTEPFMIKLQIAVVCGVIVGMPVVLYQLWRFISPGLTPRERAAARPWVPLALVFFALGVGLAYFILPYAAGFLYGFQSKQIQLLLTAEAYFGFVTMLFLAFGLVMEYPIILVLLSKVGMITSKQLRSSRRIAILIITVISTLITPGADFVSPIAMAVTMYGLYEVSIVIIRLGGH
ncbi:MAG: twin-arginine translocase subunit TatC [Candidatus Limnocylindrales bacterium]